MNGILTDLNLQSLFSIAVISVNQSKRKKFENIPIPIPLKIIVMILKRV